ncbi:MAG: sigma-70 family RNA polymerase sigma factor [Chitinophagaceae bacterium]
MTNKAFTDEELMLALRNHDDTAVNYLYYTYWPMIRKLVMSNNGNEDDAKDLYQESILDFLEKAWRKDFILTCKVKTFIYSICRYKWLYMLRGKKSFVDIEEYTDVEGSVRQASEHEVILPDSQKIQQAIASLGEPCQSLLIGFYYEGLSFEQLAVKLNYKTASVAKQQKFRCKDRLRQSFISIEMQSV